MQLTAERPAHRAKPARALAACAMLLAVLQAGGASSRAAAPAPARAAFASPLFAGVWQAADGPVAAGQVARTWLWGPAPGAAAHETFDGAPGRERLVQYFDKARMEVNDAVSDPTSPWRVTTGLLVSEMVQGRVQVGPNRFVASQPAQTTLAGEPSATSPRYADFAAASTAKATDATGTAVTATIPGRSKLAGAPPAGVTNALYVAATAHNVAGVFLRFMEQPAAGGSGPLFDWVYLLGYPVTEPYWVTITLNGHQEPALVQLFQRRVLTYVPSYASGWQVQMGNVGQHYHDWRYAAPGGPGGPGGPATTPSPEVPKLMPASGGFVGIEGDKLVQGGKTVTLKGTNYWLSAAPFAGTWGEWNGPRVREELAKARELGVNSVRIGLPFDDGDTMDVLWGERPMEQVGPWIRSMMTQLLQIAASYDMKVVFVLFDWHDEYPPTGSRQEAPYLAYIDGIVGPFANDDRVLAWDLHNEPDFYEKWQRGLQDDVIYWLRNMATAVRRVDQRHPVTVGIGNYANLWYPATDGTTILDIVDFVSFHCYDAGALPEQVKALRARTTKPVVLGEMGWPTSLDGEEPVPGAVYDEPTQTYLYTTMLRDASALGLPGVMQWTLWDYSGGKTHIVPGHERNFGLVRAGGTFKPAAAVFRDAFSAPPLPSETHTDLPLDTSDRPLTRP